MNTSRVWRYVLTRRAVRDMERLDRSIRQRVFVALDRFVADPSRGDIRKLEGGLGEWRLRVGDWRVRYEVDTDAQTIVVLRVLPRGRAYR